MTLPIKITCASLNFQKLDTYALNSLADAFIENNSESISNFKNNAGFQIEQLAIITKCNAVIIVFCYYGDLSEDFTRGRVLDTWDRLSRKGITGAIRHIKFFHDINAIKYLGECSVGLHSVTMGDSQVMSQLCEALQNAANIQPKNPTFSTLIFWLKNITPEVRLRTGLLEGNTSLERISTEFIQKKLKPGIDKISLIGYGMSGRLIAKILAEELNYELTLANRTPAALDEIRKKKFIEVAEMHDYNTLLANTCIILAIDNNEESIKYSAEITKHLKDASSNVNLIVDLSSPSLIDAKMLGIDLINLEDLSNEASAHIAKRASEAVKARDLINKNCDIAVKNLNDSFNKLSIQGQTKKMGSKLSPPKLNLFRIRNMVYKSIRKYLDEDGFIEVTTPYIVGVSTDPSKVGNGSTINVDWPGGVKAFLRQSNQLYKQILVVSGLDKIYEIGPFWRSETKQSYRHLQESIGLDVELSKPKELRELYKLAYEVILNVKKELEKTKGVKNLCPKMPNFKDVPVMTYAEAIELLNSRGHFINIGEDLGLTGEAKLGQIIKKERSSDIFIVENYPDTVKKFYTKKIGGGLTATFDIIMSGWEIVSGAIRETDLETIKKSMKLSGIDIGEYNFYLSIVGNSVPHGGFCLGLDRLVAKLLDLEMVSDAVVFPRTFKNLIP